MRVLSLLFCLFCISVNAETIRLSQPVATDSNSETFGEMFDHSLDSLSLKQLMQSPEQQGSESFLLKTEISKVCQKKGCFFIAREGATAVRVAFKDYGFFIPTDASGKQVLLNGTLIAKTMSKEQADHFNKDLKANAEIQTGKTFEILARGVTIYN